MVVFKRRRIFEIRCIPSLLAEMRYIITARSGCRIRGCIIHSKPATNHRVACIRVVRRRRFVMASGFSTLTQKIWNLIL